MAQVQLLNLSNSGLKGLNTDISPWELPPEAITDGINFRIRGNAIESSGGYSLWATHPTPDNFGYIQYVRSTGGDLWMIGGRLRVTAFDGNTFTDISSSVDGYVGLGPDDELKWSGDMLGKVAVMNNPQSYPEYWNTVSTGQALQRLPFSPTQSFQDALISGKIIRAHKNFLFLLNLQEGNEELPNGYRWSHPANINAIPFTWDETDPSALAGWAQLGGDGGPIIDGRTLRDSFVIYSSDAINILHPSLDEFVWRRVELSNSYGLVASEALVAVNGVHYFLTDGDIMRNDGNSVQSIAHNRIKKRLNSRVNANVYTRSFAINNIASKEVWFCIAEDDSMYPNMAYVYNWRDDSWAIRELPPNSAYATYGTYRPLGDLTSLWDDSTLDWDSDSNTWGSESRSPLSQTIVGVDNITSSIGVFDPSNKTLSGALVSSIERTELQISGVKGINTLTRVYPHLISESPVNIQFGSHDHIGAGVKWGPVNVFNPSTDRKIDIRTTGSLHAYRVSSIDDKSWSLSGLTVEYTANGIR